jgi:integrase
MTRAQRKRSNGEGSIYQRKDGRWTAAYYVPDQNGIRRRQYVYADTPEVVEDKLVEIRKLVKSGIPISPAGLTLDTYLSEWVDQVAAPRVRPSTLDSYRAAIEKRIIPRLGRKKLGQLNARDVRQFLAALAGEGVGDRTAQVAHATLRAALEDAVREEVIPRNVAKLVRAPRPTKAEREPLTVDQVKALLKVSRDHRMHPLIVVLAVLGLRRSEALGLRWEDIDLTAGILRVRRSLHRVDGRLSIFPTKTQRSARAVPLPRFVIRALESQRDKQEEERAALGKNWPNFGYVFTTPLGTPIDPRNCTRVVRKQLDAAGLSHVRLHDLRHGCVTVLLSMGVPPRVVMEIVGHSTLEMTMNVYAHVSLDDKRTALDGFADELDEDPK